MAWQSSQIWEQHSQDDLNFGLAWFQWYLNMHLGMVGRNSTKALGWLKLFWEIAQHSIKTKLVDESNTDNQYSDCDIADRAGIKSEKSDDDDEHGDLAGVSGPSQVHEKGDNYSTTA